MLSRRWSGTLADLTPPDDPPDVPADLAMPKAGKRPSSIDVARLAGVSQSAVSRSFTPGASVSKKTREKVMEAAAALGYQPNALPRMILTQRSNLVALVMGNLENPFYPEVLRLFISGLDALGYRAVVLGLDGAAGDASKSIEAAFAEAIRYRVDGIIVTSANVPEATAHTCRQMHVPVVLFNRVLTAEGVSSIGCDNRGSGYVVGSHLLAGGHKRFGFASGDRTAPSNQLRFDGYAVRLKAAGHTPETAGNANSYEAGFDAALKLCGGSEPCDAVFCGSDVVAFGALDALKHKLGLSVPEDVAVVGFDDVPTAG
ncbi:MAG: LacI family DNA-binding transcriptional regulator, partial [Pseudomonadota bacterium]